MRISSSILAPSRSLNFATFGGDGGRLCVMGGGYTNAAELGREGRSCFYSCSSCFHRHRVRSLQRFQQFGVEKEVDESDMSDTIVIAVGSRILTVNHHLLEIVSRVLKRKCFLCHFLCIRNHPRRLDVDAFIAAVDHKIDFVSGSDMLTVGCCLSLKCSHVNGIAVPKQFIVDDVFHQMRVFNLTEVKSGIAQTGVGCVVFVRIVKIVVPLDVKTFCFGNEKRICEIVEIFDNCISVTFGSSRSLQEVCNSCWIGKASNIAHYGIDYGVKKGFIAQSAFFLKVFQINRTEKAVEIFPFVGFVLPYCTFRKSAVSKVFKQRAMRICFGGTPCVEFGKRKRSDSNCFASAAEFSSDIAFEHFGIGTRHINIDKRHSFELTEYAVEFYVAVFSVIGMDSCEVNMFRQIGFAKLNLINKNIVPFSVFYNFCTKIFAEFIWAAQRFVDAGFKIHFDYVVRSDSFFKKMILEKIEEQEALSASSDAGDKFNESIVLGPNYFRKQFISIDYHRKPCYLFWDLSQKFSCHKVYHIRGSLTSAVSIN